MSYLWLLPLAIVWIVCITMCFKLPFTEEVQSIMSAGTIVTAIALATRWL